MTPLERAGSVATAAHDLERLAAGRDPAVRERVAGNPNIGLATLERLSVRFAGAVLANPLLDLLGLENANWVSELPEFARLALLRDPSCPRAWLEKALLTELNENTRDALAALQNPVCSAELLGAVSNPEVLEVAKLHVNGVTTVEGDLEQIVWQATATLERDSEALKDAAAVRILPAWLLGVLSLSDDLELALLAARHADSDAATLERLVFHVDPDVRSAVLQRELPLALRAFIQRVSGDTVLADDDVQRLLPTEHGRWLVAGRGHAAQLEALVTDSDWRVRQAVAQNPALGAQHLATLAKDLDKDVRCAVASHANTPKSVLARLLLDDHEEVRALARANDAAPPALRASLRKLETGDPSLPSPVLEKLSRRDEGLALLAVSHPSAKSALLRFLSTHEAWKVRQAVAQSRHSTLETLQQLAGDHDYDVRAAVAMHSLVTPALTETFSRDAHPLVRSAVALNPRSAPLLLERLATDSDADVRQAVAVSATTAALLETLCGDPQDGVRRAVALNPRCPPSLLERLSIDTDAGVRAVVADHAAATRGCAIGLFGTDFDWQGLYQHVKSAGDVLESELRFLAGLNDFALSLALAHPNCPSDVLVALFTHEEWPLRQRVAQHPKTSAALLELLAADGDYDVRAAVALHAATPQSTLLTLSRDDQGAVRKAIAGREDLTPEITETLAWDEDDEVLSALGQTSSLRELAQTGQPLDSAALGRLIEIGTPLALRLCASNPAVKGETLRGLSSSSDWRVRVAVAQQAACEAETLELLCTDADADVRRAVAGNPSTPAALLTRLLRDDDQGVRRAVLGNRHLPLEWLLAQRSAVLIRNLTLRGLNRLIALEQADLPHSEFLKTRNLHALSWLERLALTRNPSAPRAALEVLSNDANRFVRMMAQIRLQRLDEAALEMKDSSPLETAALEVKKSGRLEVDHD